MKYRIVLVPILLMSYLSLPQCQKQKEIPADYEWVEKDGTVTRFNKEDAEPFSTDDINELKMPSWNDVVAEVNVVGLDNDQIRELAKSGRICEVFGHCWRDGRPGEGSDGYFADYNPHTYYRTCKICGKCQEQDLSWK